MELIRAQHRIIACDNGATLAQYIHGGRLDDMLATAGPQLEGLLKKLTEAHTMILECASQPELRND